MPRHFCPKFRDVFGFLHFFYLACSSCDYLEAWVPCLCMFVKVSSPDAAARHRWSRHRASRSGFTLLVFASLAWQKPINTTPPPIYFLFCLTHAGKFTILAVPKHTARYDVRSLFSRHFCFFFIESPWIWALTVTVQFTNQLDGQSKTELFGTWSLLNLLPPNPSHRFIFAENTVWLWGGRLVFETRPPCAECLNLDISGLNCCLLSPPPPFVSCGL